MRSSSKRLVNPRKLLLSKWTAVSPQQNEKNFLVTKLLMAEAHTAQFDTVELEAVHSRRNFVLPWRDLTDPAQWLQGWK